MQFELTKATEALKFELNKREVDSILPCQVKLAFDVSYSFEDEHRNGYTQQLLNRFVPFAMLFDKDKTLESYVFASDEEQLTDINERNYFDYIHKQVMRSNSYGGGTAYLPVLRHMLQPKSADINPVEEIVEAASGLFGRLFGKKKVTVVTPVTATVAAQEDKNLIFFVTDGEAADQQRAQEFLDASMPDGKNFIVFISIGNRDFKFFVDNYKNTKYSSYFNLTPKELRVLEDMSDEDMYNLILTPQLIEWMK